MKKSITYQNGRNGASHISHQSGRHRIAGTLDAHRTEIEALFVLVAKATTDKVVAEIKQYEPRILKTSLSKEQEDKLRALLAGPALSGDVSAAG